jgi:hypothetical protein
MKIGVIGSGKIGATSARLFADAGHDVWIANSRGPESLVDLASEIGVQPATVEQAFAEGDVILLAIPLGRYRELPRDAAAGKIVIDADNYYPGRDGQIGELDADETTSTDSPSKGTPPPQARIGWRSLEPATTAPPRRSLRS